MLLEVQGLRAAHGQLVAVRDLGFSIARGEVVALIGANGAGKTTLLRCLAGVHPTAAGRVTLAGQDITALLAHQRVRRGLAMVPEGRRLFDDMSVRENLRVAGDHGRAGEWTLPRVLEALPALPPIIDRPAGALSGGQRQAAAIGRALMTNPDVLLLDEVSLGLSPLAVEEVYRNLAALAGRTSLLLVEQDLSRAMAFADRVLCLREGRIVLQGPAQSLTREAVTAAYFGVEFDVEAERPMETQP
ncbi:MAG: ABC transporter ATP-binding protein [Gammaproteobacteria bacterium]|nr:ABC transporter ATP-binding protein [Gammaproteobacteria bacterium]MBU4279325.1 ABC transporter ATP-binding protein [Gammaproteobacteria bacterium]MBU4321977.1 ABC transporter ATP-binding protein [Gammaproteobacteria bacterium]MBU4506635.1 ABC transporter ATP-binding protein [Gammaproteobacteria bacterium]